MLLAFYLPTAIFAFCDGLLVPTLPLFAATFDDRLGVVGVILAAEAFGLLLFDLPAGRLLRFVTPKTAILLGGGVYGVSLLLTPLAPDVSALVALRVVAGAGLALFGVSRHAYLAAAAHAARRGRLISAYGGVNRLGSFVGPLAGGVVASLLGLGAPFVVAAGMCFAAVWMMLALLPAIEVNARVNGGSGDAERDRAEVARALRASRNDLLVAGTGQLLGQAVRAGRKVLLPLVGAQVLGLEVAAVGVVVGAAGFADMAMAYPAGWLMDRFGRKHAILPCFAIQAIGLALLPLAGGFLGLLAAGVVIGIGNGLGSGNMMTLGADLAPPTAMGEFLGLWRLIGDVGWVGGPLAVGAVAQALSFSAAALTIAGVGVAAVLWFGLLVPETRGRAVARAADAA